MDLIQLWRAPFVVAACNSNFRSALIHVSALFTWRTYPFELLPLQAGALIVITACFVSDLKGLRAGVYVHL